MAYSNEIRQVLMHQKPPGLLIDIEDRPNEPWFRLIVYRDNIESQPDDIKLGMILWLTEKLHEVDKITPVVLEVLDYVPKGDSS